MENINVLYSYNKSVEKMLGLEMMAYNVVSNEGLGTFIKDIAIFFLNKINRVMDLLQVDRFRVRGLEDYNQFVKDLNSVRREIDAISRTSADKYGRIKSIMIPNIVGSKVAMYEAAAELKDLMKIVEENAEPVLKTLDTFVSKVLTDKDLRNSSRPLEAQPVVKEVTSKIEKGLSNTIDPKSILDVNTFEKVYPNWKTFKDAYDTFLSTSRYGCIENLQYLLKLVGSIADKVKVICEEAKSKNYELSKHVVKKMGSDFENCAKFITACFAVIHAYNQGCTALKNSVDMMKKKKII